MVAQVASGTETARIYANLLVSFMLVWRRFALIYNGFLLANVLAWKAAGLPTET
jgi:hypothetical protein